MKNDHSENRCETCRYWKTVLYDKSGNHQIGLRCCHYCLDRHQARKKDGDNCLSYIRKEEIF